MLFLIKKIQHLAFPETIIYKKGCGQIIIEKGNGHDSSFSENYEGVKRRGFSMEKMKKVLKYQPKVNLEEGIKRLIDWYKIERLYYGDNK